MRLSFRKIIIRLSILIVPLLLVVIGHLLTFDDKHCIGNEHMHVTPFIGIAWLAVIWFQCWLVFIIVELIYFLLKKYLKR